MESPFSIARRLHRLKIRARKYGVHALSCGLFVVLFPLIVATLILQRIGVPIEFEDDGQGSAGDVDVMRLPL